MPLPFYPDFATTDDPASGFVLTVYSPRFSTGYFPQRNRFTVLVETHSWKPYEHRVRVTRNTIVGLVELMAAHGATVVDPGAAGRRRNERAGRQRGRAGLRFRLARAHESRQLDARAGRCRRAPDRLPRLRLHARAVGDLGRARHDLRSEDAADLARAVSRRRAAVTDRHGARRRISRSAGSRRDRAGKLALHGIESRVLDDCHSDMRQSRHFARSASSSPARRSKAACGRRWTGSGATKCNRSLRARCSCRSTQPLARLVLALLEPQAPDSFAAWGFFNACFEQKEQIEPYVAEKIAREMLAADPALRAEFARAAGAGCRVRRERGRAAGVLPAPARVVGRALQSLSDLSPQRAGTMMHRACG